MSTTALRHLRRALASGIALTFSCQSIAQEFCDSVHRLDAAAPGEFASIISLKTESSDDYEEYELRREFILAGVRSRSDCKVAVLKVDGVSEGEVECDIRLPDFNNARTQNESRRVAEALAKCLAPTSLSLGNAIHRFSTRSARWEVVVPASANHINVRIIPKR